MGKGDRRGKFKPLPELAVIPKRIKSGKRGYAEPKPARNMDRDPQRVALSARCRQFGIENTPANRKALTGQHMGAQMGYVIEVMAGRKEVAALWDTWQHFCVVRSNYLRLVLNISPNPRGAAIGFIPDEMMTDPSATVDTRSLAEREQDAERAWLRFRGYLGQLDPLQKLVLQTAVDGNGRELWMDCTPTNHGRLTFGALQALHSAME